MNSSEVITPYINFAGFLSGFKFQTAFIKQKQN